VRDARLDLAKVELLSHTLNVDPIKLLNDLERLPVATFGAVAGVAGRTDNLVRLLSEDVPDPDRATPDREILRLVLELSRELDRTVSEADTESLLAETLGVLFDLAGVAIIKGQSSEGGWLVRSLWGMGFSRFTLSGERLRSFSAAGGSCRLPPSELAGILPEAAGSSGTLIPLDSGGGLLGMLLLIGEPQRGDSLVLQELLAGRAALRLAGLRKEAADREQRALSERLLAIYDELARIDSMDELCSTLLNRFCELVRATSGSIMLHDQDRDMLAISAVRGMNPALANKFFVRMGSGIAGRVASTGQPLLVNDIVNDGRFPVGRRPRFRTGSFISVPLICTGELIGVLNLADREDRQPFTDADLQLLQRVSGHAAAIMRRVKAQEGIRQLEILSVTDPLTELYNRRFLERRMDEELARSIRYGLRLSVMLLDLDSFKLYNDICGHQAGDRALQQVARILKRSVREIDVVTRYGGEEFCVLLPETPNLDAMYVAERIRYGIEHELFAGEENLPRGSLTISIGISTYPDNGSSAEELISSADVALYRAKADGRNKIVDSMEIPGTGKFKLLTRPPTIQTH
jgi:diguanylate cyclase (GGDEF)-like protein